MSSGLSGSCQTARMLADDYEGKVFVVNNQRISVTQRRSALDAKELAEAGFHGEQIFEILERVKMESSIYITVDTLKFLKKGGRITRQRQHWERFFASSRCCRSRVRSWTLFPRCAL